jgi:hypothetical protein
MIKIVLSWAKLEDVLGVIKKIPADNLQEMNAQKHKENKILFTFSFLPS